MTGSNPPERLTMASVREGEGDRDITADGEEIGTTTGVTRNIQ